MYILDDARRKEIAATLLQQLGDLPGVDAVYSPDEFNQLGQPTHAEDPHAPDLWLAAQAEYSFSDSFAGENPVVPRAERAGTHGYHPKHADLLGTCVVWGPSVKPGTKLGQVSNLQIAPTIAEVLGVELPSATGTPLPGIAQE